MVEGRQRGWVLAALGMLLVSTDSYFVRLADIDGWTMAFLVSVVSLPVQLVLQKVVEGGDAVGAFRASPRGLATVPSAHPASGRGQITQMHARARRPGCC